MRDEKDDGAGALFTRIASVGAYVPALFRWEIQSVLLGAERANRIDPDDVDAALDALRDLPIVVESAGERVFSGSELHLARHYDSHPMTRPISPWLPAGVYHLRRSTLLWRTPHRILA